jgi:hypothetical protein
MKERRTVKMKKDKVGNRNGRKVKKLHKFILMIKRVQPSNNNKECVGIHVSFNSRS